MSTTTDKELQKLLKQFPPPRNSEIFQAKWKLFLPKIVRRQNFSQAHLAQLEVLCDLFVEYANLRDVVDMTGHTYKTPDGLVKQYPEVPQMNACRNQIVYYTRMLGLLLTKDTTEAEEPTEKVEWS